MSFRRHRTNMHNLLSQDGRTDDWFDWSIAVSDDFLVTGEAYVDDNNSEDTVFAYVFSAFDSRQLHKLLPKVLCQGDNWIISVPVSDYIGDSTVQMIS